MICALTTDNINAPTLVALDPKETLQSAEVTGNAWFGSTGLAASTDSSLVEDDAFGLSLPKRGRPRTFSLSEAQILGWADAHHKRTGEWPTAASGAVAGVPGENWSALNAALRVGARGLPGDDSLARLLRRERRMGERRGRTPQVARQLLVNHLHSRGLSPAEIGRRLGISRQAAWEMLKRTAEVAGQAAG